jgi:adenosylhomocysteine nucleosidase
MLALSSFSAFSALPAMTLGILAALHDEVDGLIAAMRHEDARATKRTIGMRDYYSGTLHGQPVVLVLARIGKVAAATTVTLIREFGVNEIVFRLGRRCRPGGSGGRYRGG